MEYMNMKYSLIMGEERNDVDLVEIMFGYV